MNPAWDGGVLREAWAQRMPPWVRSLDGWPTCDKFLFRLGNRLGPHEELGEHPIEARVHVGKPSMRQDEALVSMHQSLRALQFTT